MEQQLPPYNMEEQLPVTDYYGEHNQSNIMDQGASVSTTIAVSSESENTSPTFNTGAASIGSVGGSIESTMETSPVSVLGEVPQTESAAIEETSELTPIPECREEEGAVDETINAV